MSERDNEERSAGCLRCTRRTALRLGAGVAVGLTTGAVLPACGDLSELEGNIRVTLSDYPALAEQGQFAELPPAETGFEFPIFVRREGEQAYLALSGECDHLSCAVDLGEEAFECPCHGSRFSLDGELLEGPASQGLLEFETRVEEEETLVITNLS